MFMGWTLHMIMCVLLCYPVSFYMLQLLLTGRPISTFSYLLMQPQAQKHLMIFQDRQIQFL